MTDAVKRWLDRCEREGLALHSFVIRRRGQVLAEGAFDPYRLDERHMLYSLSKSFTSTAIAFAIQEGLLTVEDRVLDFFREDLASAEGLWNFTPSERMERLSVKHLLTMNTGHAEEPEIFNEQMNWPAQFLASELSHEPGSHFLYNTPASFMLSVILTKLSGERCVEYLKTRLFEPLGFESDPWWESYEGYDAGGFGLNLSVMDISRFAEFCLNEGRWEGKQLLNAAWFKEATYPWSDNSAGDPDNQSDWSQGYGYQFWNCRHEGIYRGDGACGQFAIIMPNERATIAITAGTDKMGDILSAIWEELLPSLSEASEAETQLGASEALESFETKRFEGLELWTPEVEGESAECDSFLEQAKPYMNQPLRLTRNARGLEAIELTKVQFSVKLRGGQAWTAIPLEASGWTRLSFDAGADPFLGVGERRRSRSIDNLLPTVAAARTEVKKDEEKGTYLVIDLAFTETPWVDRWICEIDSEGLKLQMARLSGFGSFEERAFANKA